MAHGQSNTASPSLVDHLRETLTGLIENPYPHVPNPDSCKKRASVAAILRIRPNYDHWPESNIEQERYDPDISPIEFLDRFFAQSWVRHGDPEIVFIKRAARVGDRWTSHVAF